MDKVVAVIAAHLASTRFPRKVLANIAGKSMLQHVVERTQRAKHIDAVVVALDPDEPELEGYCREMGWPVYVGHHRPKDVLSLTYDAARTYGAKHIVRVTSDEPLIDPAIIDLVIDKYHEAGTSYCSNIWPSRTYPDGEDVEVFSLPLLAQAASHAMHPRYREHVTQWMLHTGIAKAFVRYDQDLSSLHWTVDTLDDLPFIRSVYDQLTEPFGLQDILGVLCDGTAHKG